MVEEELVFSKYIDDVPAEKVRHTITRTRRTSKVATTKDFGLPLHIKSGIPQMDIRKLRGMMNEKQRIRFDQTWKMLLEVPDERAPAPKFKSFLPASDVELLEAQGFITRVTTAEAAKRPSRDWVIPFTVVEPAEDGSERRRFIAWTQGDNERIKETYHPHVELKHAAYYLHRVKEQTAVKRDLACGFWQVVTVTPPFNMHPLLTPL